MAARRNREREFGPQIPLAPLQDWVNGLLAHGWTHAEIADRLCITVRTLWRINNGMDGGKPAKPTTTWARYRVEDMLEQAGVPVERLYPDLEPYGEIDELEPDAFCPRCGEDVTPIKSCCPWCDTQTFELWGDGRGEAA